MKAIKALHEELETPLPTDTYQRVFKAFNHVCTGVYMQISMVVGRGGGMTARGKRRNVIKKKCKLA